jgi:hypothetical protein
MFPGQLIRLVAILSSTINKLYQAILTAALGTIDVMLLGSKRQADSNNGRLLAQSAVSLDKSTVKAP